MQVPAGPRCAADVALGILVPLVLARIEPLVDRVPSLGLFRGSAALVLLAGAPCLGGGRGAGARRAAGPFPPPAPALPLLLAPAYAALGREGCVLLMALLAAA